MVSRKEPADEAGHDDERGVYGISVAADLAGTGVQNLRLYERRGLLEPSRSPGGTRLYSRSDVHRLTRITQLLAKGLNLAGIAMVLDLQDDNSRLRSRSAPDGQQTQQEPGRR
jgi:MerR family transcriptional regulator/heat shock protein HspR